MEGFKIEPATEMDAKEILALYKSNLGGAADWFEGYPNEDNIKTDLANDALFVMHDKDGRVAAVISIDYDEEVDKLSCWSEDLKPSGELSRLCVRDDMRNRGVARQMMEYGFDRLREMGYKGVHILVKTGHVVALQSYSHLNFTTVGECDMFDKHFWCMERKL